MPFNNDPPQSTNTCMMIGVQETDGFLGHNKENLAKKPTEFRIRKVFPSKFKN